MVIPLLIAYFNRKKTEGPSSTKLIFMNIRVFIATAVIGILTGLDDDLYARGVSRLPVSTFSLIITSKLAFTAFFAFILVKQKFTAYSINAVVLLTVGSAVLAMHTKNDRPKGESKRMYILGFIMALAAAALHGLILPMVELMFQKAKQAITYTLVLEVQLVMCVLATGFCTVGLLVNKDFQILKWMEDNNRTRMLATDHAMRMELIIKTRNFKEAEEYFENLSNTVSRKAACLPLLHSYVKERATKKAEAFMSKMNLLGLVVSPHPFNEMMKLYMATSVQEKVLSVIQQMKQNQIPRNVLSYNLWMNACAELSGPASAEMVYKEMINDKSVAVGWSSFSTLATIYQKSGLIDKAFWALRQAEKKLSTSNRLGYLFLLTIYASLNSKDEVLRLWKISKSVDGRITCANYMCILSCLVKLRDTKEAEKIFLEWECQCRTYDIRVPNILLGAYSRSGSMMNAESLLLHTLDRGGLPNFKTWEILMEGLVRIHEMNDSIDAMTRILGCSL